MTNILCPTIPDSFASARILKTFFNVTDQNIIQKALLERERVTLGVPGESCKTNLFFGFFFDGTKNNYVLGDKAGNQSNVARLYDCYPGQSVDGVLPKDSDWKNNPSEYGHFFKVYAPGVASPFEAIKDSGKGRDLTKGAGFGYLGEDRIKWGLIQAINNVHRYFYKAPLLTPEETRSYIRTMTLNARQRRQMADLPAGSGGQFDERQKNTADIFEELLKRLHARISIYWPDPVTCRPKKIDPAQVKKIYVSAFGFSRGAAQARAFTNWFLSLCELDARLCGRGAKRSLGGFEVEFDFLGLFDTVASVGIANTLGNSKLFGKFDGHGAWADAEDSLRIQEGIRCLHLVAAHEVRRSFPLDSIAVLHSMPERCEEVIFPGVHSDLGSGYTPLEQGRGTDASGGDMLARIPLLYMYREARLAGVPLKLELADEKVKNKFKVAPATITAVNQYLDYCKVKSGSITDIMREQGKLQMLWHKARRVANDHPLERTDSFLRATNFDKNDLHSANLEFESEIKKFEKWLRSKPKTFVPAPQKAGFANKYENEWEEIAAWWHSAPTLPDEVLGFFDNYVHDSHAWFKLGSDFPDNEPELQQHLVKWEARRKRAITEAARQASSTDGTRQSSPEELDGLTDDQRQAAQEFALTKQTPRLITSGRESDELFVFAIRGGYLRFRKIYGGADEYLLSKSHERDAKEATSA
jgi:hypothetical protein